jgi:hypothetical protein
LKDKSRGVIKKLEQVLSRAKKGTTEAPLTQSKIAALWPGGRPGEGTTVISKRRLCDLEALCSVVPDRQNELLTGLAFAGAVLTQLQ